MVQIVAADTDVLAILLLNYQHFSARTVLFDQSDNAKVHDQDQDTDVLLLRQIGEIYVPYFFGLIHPLFSSDILCSQRTFEPAAVLKACIDFSSYLFIRPKGIQNLAKEYHDCKDAYARYILALFQKQYANKIKMRAVEMFDINANIPEVL